MMPQLPEGFTVEVVADGLDGPTQLAVLPDGRLAVAQLNGREGAATGQVVALDPDGGAPEVLVEGLVTPTGVAVLDDELWVMERRALSRGPVTGGERAVVLAELPFNGRSEGALTVLDGTLLYDTSGELVGDEVTDGSGVLWSLAPPAPGGAVEPEVVATGFKHAYARTVDGDGTIWQTEVVDGPFDGRQASDELVAVVPGTDGGWPRCIDDRVPVADNGGTDAACATTARPHALFGEGATPTAVAVAPWADGELLVALWNDGVVVRLPRAGGDGPVEAEPFLTGIDHPQDLLVDGDRLLVTDHGGGRVLAVTADRG